MDTQDQVPSPRVPLKLNVEFRRSYGRNSASGVLKNISMTGAFLEHQMENVQAGDKLQLTFKVGGRQRKVNAQIIWCNKIGAGIKFLPVNGRDVQIVDDLMYFVESKRETRRSLIDEIFKRAS